MNSSTRIGSAVSLRGPAWAGLLGLLALAGCSSLLPAPPAAPTLFLLQGVATGAVDPPSPPAGAAARATLVVAEPRAAAGYGTRRIAYVRAPGQLEYFAFSEWVEPPALMLAPLLARAIERTGAYRAVVRVTVPVAADVRLETELVRLQQDFSVAPSRVRLTLRAVLVEVATRRVLATREFDADAASTSEDPAGGVTAGNLLAGRIATDVGAFCADWASPSR